MGFTTARLVNPMHADRSFILYLLLEIPVTLSFMYQLSYLSHLPFGIKIVLCYVAGQLYS